MSPIDISLTFSTVHVGGASTVTLVVVLMAIYLAKLSSASWQALAVANWSFSSAISYVIANKTSICSADYWEFEEGWLADQGRSIGGALEGGRETIGWSPIGRQVVRWQQAGGGGRASEGFWGMRLRSELSL